MKNRLLPSRWGHTWRSAKTHNPFFHEQSSIFENRWQDPQEVVLHLETHSQGRTILFHGIEEEIRCCYTPLLGGWAEFACSNTTLIPNWDAQSGVHRFSFLPYPVGSNQAVRTHDLQQPKNKGVDCIKIRCMAPTRLTRAARSCSADRTDWKNQL